MIRKKQKLTGILTLTGVITLVILLFIIQAKAQLVPAVYVKLAMVNFAFVVISAGLYLVSAFCEGTSKQMEMIITTTGFILAALAILVCFDILPFRQSVNWLVSLGIIYILLVQLQLLNWGRKTSNLIRFSTLFVILSDAFLVFAWIAMWTSPAIAVWIYLATTVSVSLTFVGVVLPGKKAINQ
jgi:hypothetical protein